MPKREDINTILILGSGPIVIGQGCEFDYAGAQACKALKSEGYRVVLVNSNPATIMTDPGLSDRTYIEPITPASVRKIIEKEASLGNPVDALLPTLGGQTALNCACELWDNGSLSELDVEMIGASRDVIHRAEDRQQFRDVCEEAGLEMPRARVVSSLDEAHSFLDEIGLPAIIRPAFTLGGTGGGIAYNKDEFHDLVSSGLRESMISQIQIDESILGWKEYELEVIRDRNDNCIIVCGIENIDPMGVHTGDSITVAPILTLTDREYQAMRDAAIAILRTVGVETGGSNVQFAVNPEDGRMLVVEMNPRVSRSSALASKATGFPIAKVAARLAVGYSLDELRNDITGTTSACFEPTIDYIVTKMPRWTFEKFPEADETLTTQMKSVGEGMAIGRTFKESFQKAIRSMEVKRFGFGLDASDKWLNHKFLLDAGDPADDEPYPIPEEKLVRKLSVPSQGRMYYIRYALKQGWSIERVHSHTKIDPFFLDEFKQLVEFEDTLCSYETIESLPDEHLARAKQLGFSDHQLAYLYTHKITTHSILAIREHRKKRNITPVYKLVDTCAAEFQAITPYYYATYERPHFDGTTTDTDDELEPSETPKVVILGGGPNRIGQGIEFDYCCVHAAYASHDLGFESVMINSNPETVSTDYDTSTLLFFEPLTLEDVLNVVEYLGDTVHGLVVQFGGQTPLNLAHALSSAGAPIIGTPLDSIDLAEDRERFKNLLERLDLRQPPSGIAHTLEQAITIARNIGYPVLVRPSYVLGGRGMEICHDERAMTRYMANAVNISEMADAPVLIDKFLANAIEVDVDVVADFDDDQNGRAVVCGVMEHIEHAGVHSGDSTCTIPPSSLSNKTIDTIRQIARELARALHVNGLMNLQLAVHDEEISIIEVNPRASRTAPFVSKAKGVAWPRVAASCMLGRSLDDQHIEERPDTGIYSVKAPVFPFKKFPHTDFVLGPEMRSTGEVMGVDASLPIAFAKALTSAGTTLPTDGNVFLSVRDADKQRLVPVARSLRAMGFTIYTTRGTAAFLEKNSIQAETLKKIEEGARPNVLDMLANGDIDLVINTPTRTGYDTDEGHIRATTVRLGIPMITTGSGAIAAVQAIEALRAGSWDVSALQDHHPEHATPHNMELSR
ncbi:MAG: carbamoyl-phosphate synthase large subunit [Planctomycetota bacterium]|jgi:carbamoyl-phosphate synthase large subunit